MKFFFKDKYFGLNQIVAHFSESYLEIVMSYE